MRKLVGVLSLAVLVCGGVCFATSVAIYNPETDGGSSCGEKGIFDALSKMRGINPDFVTELSEGSLGEFDVLVVPDVYRLGKKGKGWEDALRAFNKRGGGIFYSFHCPAMPPQSLFPQIVRGFRRHTAPVIPNIIPHQVTFMMVPFRTSYSDHRDIVPGEKAQILMSCEEGKPTAVVGIVGKGRVLVSGVVLGFGGGDEREPEGEELRLLRQGILWLAGRKFIENEAKKGILRCVVDDWVLQPEPLRVKVKTFVPEGMGKGIASAEIIFSNPGGKRLARESVQIDLSQEPITQMLGPKPGYRLLEKVVRFETKGLKDGNYLIRARLKSMGRKREEGYTVRLRGEMTAGDKKRNEEVRRRIRGMTIKYTFTQGFPIEKDTSVHLAFVRAVKEAGFNAFEFYPTGGFWSDEAFKIFENLLKTAQQENLYIWALLYPPPTTKALKESPDKGRSYYIKTVERFGELASKYRNFVGYTIDDFIYYMSYFTPDFLEKMTAVGRAKADSLLFTPLMYYPGIRKQFFREYGPYIDGVIFHFRADSKPASYIKGYDPSSFEDYAKCMRTELRRVMKLAGSEPVICGFYIWYTRAGWGVHYREGNKRFSEDDIRRGKVDEKLFEKHVCKDACLKLKIAHEYADAVRVYGLGIRHPAYREMGKMIRYWQERKIPWGWR